MPNILLTRLTRLLMTLLALRLALHFATRVTKLMFLYRCIASFLVLSFVANDPLVCVERKIVTRRLELPSWL